jgi:hypothetical protein
MVCNLPLIWQAWMALFNGFATDGVGTMRFLKSWKAGLSAIEWRRARSLGWLMALAMVRGLLYLSVIPPWQGVDESYHFEYIRLLVDQRSPVRTAPVEARQAMSQSMAKWHFPDFLKSEQAPQPWPAIGYPTGTIDRFSLAYIPYAVAVWPLHSFSMEIQLYAMRLVSVLIGAAVVALAFQTARLIAPDRPALALGTALFVLFLPQHTFLLASVSDGNLAELLCSAAIYWLAKLLKTGFDWRTASLCLVSAVAALLCKATGFFLIPLLGISTLALVQQYWQRWSRIAWSVAGTTLVVVTVGVWYFLREFAPMSAVAQLSLTVLQSLVSPTTYASVNAQGVFASALRGTFTSFWANLGWMRLPLPYSWYYVLMVLTVLSLAGAGIGYCRLRRTLVQPGYAFMGLAAVLPVAVLAAQFVAIPGGYTRQHGRLLFGGIVPIAFVLVSGWLHWVPTRYARLAVWVMVGGMAALDTAVWCNLAIPFFYR